MLILFQSLFILICFHPIPTTTMETDPGSFNEQIIETIMRTLDKTLKTAVATMSSRQERFEEMSTSRLGSLSHQITDLLLSIQRSDPSNSTENLSHRLNPPNPKTNISVSSSEDAVAHTSLLHPDLELNCLVMNVLAFLKLSLPLTTT